MSTWVREPFVEETGDHRPAPPEGDGLRHAAGLVGLRIASPPAGKAVTAVLATTGASNDLQAFFHLLTARADQASAAAAGR